MTIQNSARGSVRPPSVRRPGKAPQDRAERDHRQHGRDGAEQQGGRRPVRRVVRLAADTRREDVDVLLDALVRIVVGPTEELAAEVRVVTEPVVNQSAAQPDSPPHDETLHHVHVQQGDDDVHHRQDEKDADGYPEPVDARVGDMHLAGGPPLKRHLQRGEDVVGVVADQNRDPHRDDRRQQQQCEGRPHHPALPAGRSMSR